MSSTDKRIVMLEFDNAAFESGVAKTLKTLDTLSKNIENTENISKQLNKLNSIDLSSIANSFDAVKDRVSSLGIVGATILQNLTNTAVDAAKTIVSSLTGAISSGGWSRSSNIEHAKFQLAGLKVMWNDISEDIDYAVKDTAYGLDAAAMAASQLVASGVSYGQWSDDMRTALRGISGVAAMTNSEYSEIAHVFTRIAGNGKVMAIDLNSIASRGLNAAATIAEYLGTTEADVRELVHKGKIDFQTFADAMDSAFGEHAKDANKTFDGAMSNIRAALSRTGQAFIQPAIADRWYYEGELKNFVDVLNGFRVLVNGVNSALAPLAESVESVMHSISEKALEKLEWLYSKDYWTGEITDHITEPIHNAINVFLEFARNMYIGGSVIWSSLKNIGIGFKDAFAKVFPDIKSLGEYLIDLSVKFRVFAVKFREFFSNSDKDTYNILLGFRNLWDTLSYIFKNIKDGIKNIFPDSLSKLSTFLSEIPEKFAKVSFNIKLLFAGSEDRIKGITYALSGTISIIFKVLRGISQIVRAIAGSTIVPILKGLVEVILNIISHIGHLIKRVNDGLLSFSGFKDTAEGLKMALVPAKEAIEKFFKTINKGIDTFFKWIDALIDFKKDSSSFGDFFDKLTTSIASKGGGWETFADVLDRIRSIIDKITPIFKKFGEGVVSVFGGLIGAIHEIFSNKNGDGISDFGTKFVETLDKINTSIDDSEKGNKIKEFFDKIGESLKRIDWTSILEKIGSAFEIFKNVLTTAWRGISTAWSIAKPILQSIWEVIKRLWNEVTGGESLQNIAIKGGIMGVLVTLIQFINKAKTFDSKLNDIKQSVVGVFDSIRNVFVKYQESIKADVIKKIAISVGIMAASVLVLSLIDTEKLMAATGVIVVLFAALSSLFNQLTSASVDKGAVQNNIEGIKGLGSSIKDTLNSFKQAISGGQIGITLIEFAVALAILSNAIKKLAKLDPPQLIAGVATIGALVGLMIVLMAAVSEFGKQSITFSSDMTATTKALLIFSLSIGLLTLSISKLAKIEPDRLWTSVGVISMLTVALLAVIAVLGKVDPESLKKSQSAILSFAISIGVLALAATAISKISWPDLGKFGAVLLAFSGVLVGFSHAANADNMSSTKTAILLFAISMGILSGAIFVISKTPWEGIGKFGAVLAGFALIISGFSRLIDPSTVQKAALASLEFSGVMLVLGLVLRAFSGLSWGELAIAGSAIAGFALILTGVSFALSKMPGVEKKLVSFSKAAIGFGIAMFGVGAGLLLFSKSLDNLMDSAWKIPYIILSVLEGFVAVSDQMNSILFKLLDSLFDLLLGILLKKLPTFSQTVLDFVLSALDMISSNIEPIMNKVLDILISVLSSIETRIPEIAEKVFNIISKIFDIAFQKISESGFENLAIVAGSLVAFGAGLYFIGINKQVYKDALIGLGVMLLAMVSIGSILLVLSQFDSASMLNSALSLAAAMTAFAVLTFILSKIGEAGVGAIYGALFGSAALGIVVAAVASIVATVYGIMEAIKAIAGPNANVDIIGTINEVADVMAALGESIGRFVGSIVSGFANEALPGLGTALSDFMTNFQPFIDGANNINDNTIKGVESLIGIILALSAAELIDTLANNPLLTLGGKGKSFGDFLEEAKTFMSGLSDIGSIASSISDDDAKNIKRAASAGKAMADFAAAIPNSSKDGFNLLSFIVGDNDMDTFGDMMKQYAFAIVRVDEALQRHSFDEKSKERIRWAAEAGTAMTEFAKTIPNTSRDGFNFASLFVGDNDMDTFGNMMKQYAFAIVRVDETLKDNSFTTASKKRIGIAAEAGTAMTEFAKTIPNTSRDGFNFASLFVGDNDMDTFGSMMKSFATSIVDVASALTDFKSDDTNRIGYASQSGIKMADFAKQIGSINDNDHSISNLGKEMESFGTSISNYASSIEGIKFDELNTSTGIISSFTLAVNELANNSISDFELAFTTATTTTALVISDWINAAVDAISYDLFTDAGVESVNSYKDGFGSVADTAISNAEALAQNVVSALRGLYFEFKDAGTFNIEGYANGMTSYYAKSMVYNAGYSIGKTALSGTRDATLVNSPSRAFEKLGNYNGLGYVNGMVGTLGTIRSTGEAMGEESLNAMGGVIDQIMSFVDTNMDMQPVIAPVFDSSNIQNGIGYINGMFNNTGLVSAAFSGRLAGSVGTVVAPGSITTPLYNDSKVIDAITNLNSRVDSLGQSIAKMRVTLDTGALVGEIVEPVNQGLGKLSVRANRGG